MVHDDIKLQALGLPVGSTMQGVCPRCGRDRLYITRVSGTNLAYMCHRAACLLRGYTESKVSETVQKKKEVPEVQSSKLPDEVHDWLCQRYDLEPATIQEEGLTWWAAKGRVLSPIIGVEGTRYGYCARAVQSGFTGPKSLTVVQDTSWPGGLFTRTSSDSSVLIVVEDPFSAYAAAEFGYRGLALLGTHLTDALEAELGRFEEIVIALDQDATDKGARIAKRLSYLNVRQLPLERDIKDMDVHQKSAILGVY